MIKCTLRLRSSLCSTWVPQWHRVKTYVSQLNVTNSTGADNSIYGLTCSSSYIVRTNHMGSNHIQANLKLDHKLDQCITYEPTTAHKCNQTSYEPLASPTNTLTAVTTSWDCLEDILVPVGTWDDYYWGDFLHVCRKPVSELFINKLDFQC